MTVEKEDVPLILSGLGRLALGQLASGLGKRISARIYVLGSTQCWTP